MHLAQAGHLEYQRASRHAPPQQVVETGLSRFEDRRRSEAMSLRGSNHEDMKWGDSSPITSRSHFPK
jgi:hypothetical protein